MGRVGVAILETVIDFGFSYLFGVSKKVNSHRDGAGRDRHPRNCHRFWLHILLACQKCQQSQGWGGSGSPSSKLSSFLASHIFLACQKCQQSQGWGGSGSPSSKLSSFLASYLVGVSKVSTVTGMGRVGVAILESVIVFGFSYLVGVSKVSTVTGMGRVGVAILETVIVFGFSCLLGMSKVSTVTGMRRAPPKRQKPKK